MYLDVVFGDEPGPVGEDLVDLVQVAQLARDEREPAQPVGVAAGVTELARLLLDHVRALVPTGRLVNQLRNQIISLHHLKFFKKTRQH